VLGSIHTDTSMSPGTQVWVIVNTSLHVFQWQSIQLLYEYKLHFCDVQVLFLCSPYE